MDVEIVIDYGDGYNEFWVILNKIVYVDLYEFDIRWVF